MESKIWFTNITTQLTFVSVSQTKLKVPLRWGMSESIIDLMLMVMTTDNNFDSKKSVSENKVSASHSY